jgi:adenosylmethionine-8-amino-7-oxononanoate aminotransferase
MFDKRQLTDPSVLKHSVLDFRQMSAFVQQPLIFERAEGVHYWDINGKHYWDGLSGIFVVAVGHRNARVVKAMQDQLEKLTFAPPLHGTNAPAVEFSALLAELAPGDLNTVKLMPPVLETGGSPDQVQGDLALLGLPRCYAGRPGSHRHPQAPGAF